MPKLIFDIETVGVEFDSLDEKAQELLLVNAKDDQERQTIREQLGLSPLTGRIVAIGVLNPETNKGAAYYQKQNNETDEQDGDISLIPCDDEKAILKRFWEAAEHYDQFVTFNGHSFDCPFLMIRSAVNKIKPSVNLVHYRFTDKPHFDLYDKITNYGAVRFKRSLHLWCAAFGIKSPKADGVSGYEVAGLFKKKRCRDIARYCFGDIVATKELHAYWEKYLK